MVDYHIRYASDPFWIYTILFNEYDFIIAAWLSASRKGVKAFVKIPEANTVDEYKSYFWGLALEEMQQYIGFDTAPQNAVLPMFMSYDKDIKIRTNYTTWTKKGENPKQIIPREDHNYKVYSNDKYSKASVTNTEKAINKIIDNGHPQLRAAATALGGYVGAGYISKVDAEQLIMSLIRSNEYLSKGIDGYIKTGITMINAGMNKPLYLDF